MPSRYSRVQRRHTRIRGWGISTFRHLAPALPGLRSDRSGIMAVFLAIGLIPLVGAAGLAIDTTRGYLVKARLNQALDAAALAGGRVFYETDRDEDIRAFFDANFPPGFLGATVSDLAITDNPEDGRLTVAASAQIPTSLVSVLGFEHLNVTARSVVLRADRGMELVLVMDNTGSMRGSKVSQMRDAAHELVDILYADRAVVPNFWVSLVPYTATVNVGADKTAWLASGSLDRAVYELDASEVDQEDCRGTNVSWDLLRSVCTVGDAVVHSGWTEAACEDVGVWVALTNECVVSHAWKGCVEARFGSGGDVTDAPPATAPFQPYYWPRWRNGNDIESRYNSWLFDNELLLQNEDTAVDETEATNTDSNDGLGPNLGCGPAITPWTDQRSDVEDAIDEMDSWHRGGTTTNLGLVWGWRLLSPRWRGLWGDPDLPLPYDEPLMQKVAVILTDGDNLFYDGHAPSGDTDYTGYQRLSDGRIGTTNKNTARRELNRRTLQICNAMKAESIIIYTITFDVRTDSRGQDIRDTFRDCATSPGHFFDSYGGSGLSQTFRVIAAQLSNLRIAE